MDVLQLTPISIDTLRNNLLSPKVDLNKNKIIIPNEFLQGYIDSDITSISFLDFNNILNTHGENKIKKIDNKSKIDNKVNENKLEAIKVDSEIQIFINDILNTNKSYTIKNFIKKDSFIESICILLDKCSYSISSNFVKINEISTLKNKLAFDLSEKNLYKSYNLKEVSKLKKSDLIKNLTIHNNDNLIDFTITSYLSNIWNSNIIIIYYKELIYMYGSKYDVSKDSLIFIIYNDCYNIVLNDDNNNKFNNKFIEKNILENNKLKHIDESLFKNFLLGFKYENLNIKSSFKLLDYQNICNILNIDILKENGKNKSIKELINNLENKF
jgi:hypothetical protein